MAFTAPTPAELKIRYSAFASVDDGTVQYWLTDAERLVTTSWIEADYAPAIMAFAAHYLAAGGLEASATGSALPTGVTRFRSGALDVSISEAVASKSAAYGYASTRYGQEFAVFLRRNRGGPLVASSA